MKLFLISQSEVNEYDSFDSAVVAAHSEQDARTIHPSEYVTHVTDGQWMGTYSGGPEEGKEYECSSGFDWPSYSDIDCIEVKYLGETNRERGLVLASYNAG
jgi:hypothetical protein